MNLIQTIIRWSLHLAGLAKKPKVIKLPRYSGKFNTEQEEARRWRQIARHGDNYWCPIWGRNFKWYSSCPGPK